MVVQAFYYFGKYNEDNTKQGKKRYNKRKRKKVCFKKKPHNFILSSSAQNFEIFDSRWKTKLFLRWLYSFKWGMKTIVGKSNLKISIIIWLDWNKVKEWKSKIWLCKPCLVQSQTLDVCGLLLISLTRGKNKYNDNRVTPTVAAVLLI